MRPIAADCLSVTTSIRWTRPMSTATSRASRFDVSPAITITSKRYTVCLYLAVALNSPTAFNSPPALLRLTDVGVNAGLSLIARHVSSEMTVTSAPVSILKRSRLRQTGVVAGSAVDRAEKRSRRTVVAHF